MPLIYTPWRRTLEIDYLLEPITVGTLNEPLSAFAMSLRATL
jgi:hypothetical protein